MGRAHRTSRRASLRRDWSGRQDGFTLIEAAVTLAVVAVLLAAIARQIAGSVLATSRVENRLKAEGAARLVAAFLPRGGEALPRETRGSIGEIQWQLKATPFLDGPPVAGTSRFVPLRIEARLRAPDGSVRSLQTVRLQPRTGS